MSYTLIIADRTYSSWSLRAWLLFDVFSIPADVKFVQLFTKELPELLAQFAPAKTVPTIITPEGWVVSDSLAIAEELASRHPSLPLWPAEPRARSIARVLTAEMHSGFQALRTHCPMNLRCSYLDCQPTPQVLADLQRLEQLWGWAWTESHSSFPWLCGEYSIVDAYYAPMAMRIASYNLPVSAKARDYVQAHLSHPSLRRWRAMGAVDGDEQEVYRRGYSARPWPGPAPLLAGAVEGTAGAVNELCPYSGTPITHCLEIWGIRVGEEDLIDKQGLKPTIIGFCNAFCRDKTAQDPEARPLFMQLYEQHRVE